MVVCRAVYGEIAFLSGHVPYLGALDDASLRIILPGSGEQEAAVHGGFVQMTGDDLVIVLSDLAELKEQIDVPRAAARQDRGRAGAVPRSRGRRGAGGARAAPRPASRSRPAADRARQASVTAERSRPALGWLDAAARPSARRAGGAGRRRRCPSFPRTRPSISTRTGVSAPGSTCSTTRNAPQPEGSPPPVTPESVDDMAALGARTLYLQVVNPVGEPPTTLVRRRAARRVRLARARQRDAGGGVVPAVGRRRRGRHAMMQRDRGVPRRRPRLRRRRPRPRGHPGRSRRRRSGTTASSISRSARASSSGKSAPSGRSSTRRCRPS